MATWHATFLQVLSEMSTVQLTSSSLLNSALSWLTSLNPLILIILGVVAFFAGSLAKFIGIILLIAGAILLVFPYLGIHL
jgi:hypothetical protein